MSILITYASKHGSTAEIAERIAAKVRQTGNDAEVWSVESVCDVKQYGAVVIGSAVYFGSWMKEAVQFVEANRAALAARPVWLFSSGPTGETSVPDPKQIAELQEAIHPRDHRVFRGALDRHKLSFAEKMIVKGVKAPEGDFRDWDAVDTWAESIARALVPSTMTANPS
jgi:menaquinone-dependent protoporphyrinogen oxidase